MCGPVTPFHFHPSFDVSREECGANGVDRGFLWRVLAIGAVSLVPPYAVKVISRTMKPPSYRKVQST